MSHPIRSFPLSVALALFAVLTLSAEAADCVPAQGRILVTGEGTAAMAPDLAILDITVMRKAKTARAALDANSSAMADVLAALQDNGIAERDLQTSNFSINPEHVYPRAGNDEKEPRLVGYTVRNSLTVKIRDLSKLGEILDLSVTLGVNEGGNIRWSNDDPSEAISRARVAAVTAAAAKAGTLAEAAGVELGMVLELSEQSYSPRPMQKARSEMAYAASADSVPVASGENLYKVTVSVSYAIEQ